MTITWGDIGEWDENTISDVAAGLRSRSKSIQEVKDGLKNLPMIATWEGQGATAANQSLDKIAKNIIEQSAAHDESAAAMEKSALEVSLVKRMKQAAEDEAKTGHFLIDPQTGAVSADPNFEKQNPDAKADIESKVRMALQAADVADGDLRHAVNLASGAEAASGHKYNDESFSWTNKAETDRQAFEHMFGRAPTTPADFATAAALNPNSYDPKNGIAQPEVRVAKIEPHPGWGTVRTNFFIPQREVAYPSLSKAQGHNLGDNRGFDPYADPEHSRVSVLVDYENGVIVTRQNPSVDSVSGEAMAGHPWVTAGQNTNGAVAIAYSTADPFSPGGEGLAKVTGYSVHGQVVIQGGPDGAKIGGNVTQFPAVEVYHDSPKGVTDTVFTNMPANTTSYGPMVGLLNTQGIGDGELYRTMANTPLVPLGTVNAPPVITPTMPEPLHLPVGER
ncbi:MULTISPECIES: hypothetical protein [Mycobacteroides]|uniref:DUF4226 domain-containing protein n=1 Tax=Mycobacteroides franklinii TaxID=948102 RepID=A0A4V3A5X0_9MYCO|nr:MULTISPECIES: hypothetical protein [Mycobacteroides]MBN7314091.1 hypothetical protein [Mycobacteroides abscessus subsp. abscessus]TDH19915.1 hypothetical protein EJ571_17985 [Mycobacteroides franklinii]